MNSNGLKAFFSIGIMLVIAIMVTFTVMTSRTSSLGVLYLYVAIGSLVFALHNPRVAVLVLIPCTCYIDHFKRLMVYYGNPTPTEVAYILSIPPVMITGAVISVLLSFVLGYAKITKTVIISFVFASFFLALGMLGILTSSDSSTRGLRGLGAALNTGLYAYFLFLIPSLFPTTEQRIKLLKWTFYCFIPVAIYMYRHFFLGLADFEVAYLMTGLSQEYRILFENGDALRGFSTMNGSGTVSTMLSLTSLIGFVILSRSDARNPVKRVTTILLGLVMISGALMTLTRGGWVCGIVAFGAYFMFASKMRTVIAYIIGAGSLSLLILSAPYLIESRAHVKFEKDLKDVALNVWDSPEMYRTVTLGTIERRLEGWSNLLNEPKLWTPFGFSFAGKGGDSVDTQTTWGHDIFIDSLTKYGYVTTIGALTIMSIFIYRMHKFQFSFAKMDENRALIRVCIALLIGLAAGGVGSGSQFRTFPQNVYLFLWISIPFATVLDVMKRRTVDESLEGKNS
jgi:hypothetical protein